MSPFTYDKIPEDSLVSEQANVVPNKTIASRLREAHGTTGETIATAIPGAGPVMCVYAESAATGGTEYYILTKTINEIKQAIDNNIFVAIKRKVGAPVNIEYITKVHIDTSRDIFSVYAIAMSDSGNLSTTEYSTDNLNGYPERSAK